MIEDTRLKARFIKARDDDGNLDINEYFWEISSGKMIIAKMTVKSLCATNPILDYDSIATLDFGRLLLRKVKKLKAFW